MNMKLFLVYFFLSLISISSFPQVLPQTAHIETNSIMGIGNKSPFWLHSNKYGQYTENPNQLNLKIGFEKSPDTSKNWDFSYGLDFLCRTDQQFYFHQAYLKINYRIFQFHIGKMEENFGEQDKHLSSGNLLWSGNARPVPSVSFSVPNYIPVLKGFIDIKGYLSHSWIHDNRFIKNYYLHHKNAYIRLGSRFPVSFSYGLEHYAQWGGKSPEYGILPSSFSDFKKVFFAKAGGSAAPWLDTLNRLGNHLGSKNFTLEIKSNSFLTKLYWQYMFEDASKDHWENIADGLWGICIELKKSRNFKKLVFEYVNTTNQSGPIHLWNDTIQLGGEDQYFNNAVYRNGWKYYDRIMGTPFITPDNENKQNGTNNNCIKAFHVGISGVLQEKWDYRFMISYVRNYGIIIPNIGSYIYSISPPQKNILLFVETKYPLKNNFYLTFASAVDLKQNSLLGIHLSLRKNIELN